MLNGLDTNQLIAVGVNLGVLVVSLIVSGILIFKIKFDDKNYRLLFIIYTLYWIAPMLLREYTSQMQNAMAQLGDPAATGFFWWLPVTIYGIIGLFWKPLNDLFSHRLKSRKTVIYISIFIQALGAIPMIAYPCFATNVIQSLTVGIGASGIAVFSLMFNEQYAKKKVFLTVSLLSLPPLLGEFFSSVLQCCVTSFVPNQPDPTPPEYWNQYISIVKYMWVIGLFFIVATAIVTIFLKEKKAFLYQDNKYKEPVSNKWDISVIILLIFSAAITSFVKFSTSGGTIITELRYIGQHTALDPKAYEGYLSVIFTVGQMAANIITGLFLVKKMNKWSIFTIASGLWLAFGILYGSVLNVWGRMAFNFINGWAFGTTYNIIVGITLNKFFTKSNKITPITLYNTGLSIGICSSLFFKQFLTKGILGQGKIEWEDYVIKNWIVSGIVIGIIVVMWIMFTSAFFIEKNHPPKRIRVNRVKNQQDMDD